LFDASEAAGDDCVDDPGCVWDAFAPLPGACAWVSVAEGGDFETRSFLEDDGKNAKPATTSSRAAAPAPAPAAIKSRGLAGSPFSAAFSRARD
jgi:hypothetical protein